MTRPEAYALIKKYGLQNEVKDKYGRNFTQVGTDDLANVINTHEAMLGAGAAAPAKKEEKAATTVDNPYEAACVTFVGILKDCGLLDAILAKL